MLAAPVIKNHLSIDVMLKILKGVIMLLAWLRLIKRPKKEVYTVVVNVSLDGKFLNRFPAEIEAIGKKVARYELKERLSFKTGTTAENLGWDTKGNKLYKVFLMAYCDNKLINMQSVTVTASKSREAKFDLNPRLSFKITAVAKKSALIKYNKKPI